MPYNHPNKVVTRKGRSRSLRNIINLWPLAAWIGAIFIAIWAYNQGVVFRRMNGAVDIYQETVSASEDGRLDRYAEGIHRGARVTEGQIIGYMRSNVLEEEIHMVKQQIEARRLERLRDYQSDILDVESELRKVEGELTSSTAEVAATQKEIDSLMERMKRSGVTNEAQQAAITGPIVSDYNIKIATYSAIVKLRTLDRDKVVTVLEQLTKDKGILATETDLAKVAEKDHATELAQLELKRDQLVLKAARDGTVDSVIKEPGEFVRAGDAILRLIGEPTQIVGFLTQDQVDFVQEGQTVWITPSKDRTEKFDSKVLYLSPRMTTLPDATGPSVNSRIFGRSLVCEFPKGSGLLPGQTVVIWVEPPGEIPLINRILRNDDASAGK